MSFVSTSVHTDAAAARRLRPARLAVAAIFFVNGAAFAGWVVRIPAVQQNLGIGTGVLGIALLGVAVGALLSMTATGALVSRFGSAPVMRAAAILYCAALNLPALAPNPALLVAFLALFGAANGALDVSMNAQSVALEKRYRRPIMSSFHAMFSVGGLVGAAVGGAVASLGVGPKTHLLGASLCLGAISAIALPHLLPRSADGGADTGHAGTALVRPSRALIGLGVISFCVLLGEGAIADWSAVYLSDVAGTAPGSLPQGTRCSPRRWSLAAWEGTSSYGVWARDARAPRRHLGGFGLRRRLGGGRTGRCSRGFRLRRSGFLRGIPRGPERGRAYVRDVARPCDRRGLHHRVLRVSGRPAPDRLRRRARRSRCSPLHGCPDERDHRGAGRHRRSLGRGESRGRRESDRLPMVRYMSLEEQVDKDFVRARREAFFGRLKVWLRNDATSNRLSCFDEVRKARRAYVRIHVGRREVEVGRIVGSVDRYREFDRNFLPTRSNLAAKWMRVDRAFHQEEELPPVSLYRIGDEYFVHDGNHRVSVARFQGVEMIDAEVTAFASGHRSTRGLARNPAR